MTLRTFVISPIGSNCYVLSEGEESGARAVVIDPGDTALEPVFEYIDGLGLKVTAVWNTHGHFDHVMGVDLVRERYQVPAYLHADDLNQWNHMADSTRQWLGREVEPLKQPDVLWKDGDEVQLGDHRFSIWHTPGHSRGSVCLVGEELAFTGDTLFAGTIGRTDFPESNRIDMEKSLERLLQLRDSLKLYPGHFIPTTMEHERKNNPFLAGRGSRATGEKL